MKLQGTTESSQSKSVSVNGINTTMQPLGNLTIDVNSLNNLKINQSVNSRNTEDSEDTHNVVNSINTRDQIEVMSGSNNNDAKDTQKDVSSINIGDINQGVTGRNTNAHHNVIGINAGETSQTVHITNPNDNASSQCSVSASNAELNQSPVDMAELGHGEITTTTGINSANMDNDLIANS